MSPTKVVMDVCTLLEMEDINRKGTVIEIMIVLGHEMLEQPTIVIIGTCTGKRPRETWREGGLEECLKVRVGL